MNYHIQIYTKRYTGYSLNFGPQWFSLMEYARIDALDTNISNFLPVLSLKGNTKRSHKCINNVLNTFKFLIAYYIIYSLNYILGQFLLKRHFQFCYKIRAHFLFLVLYFPKKCSTFLHLKRDHKS